MMALKRQGTNFYTPLIQPFATKGLESSSSRSKTISMRVDSNKNMGAGIKPASNDVKSKKKRRKTKIGLIYRNHGKKYNNG